MLDEHESMLGRSELDKLLANIEASVRITQRTEFFTWLQGIFQSVIPHEALICGLAFPSMNCLRFEWVASFPISIERFAELCRSEGGLIYRLLKRWHESGGAPLHVCPGGGGQASEAQAEVLGLLQRFELSNAVALGLPGLDGRPASFFAFFKLPRALSEPQVRMSTMLLPHLHAAWQRVNCTGGIEGRSGDRLAVLTVREIEILSWMAKGKSNGEIAEILGISQLTVKNHVQKILRKLGVNNRTQAVARSFSMSVSARVPESE